MVRPSTPRAAERERDDRRLAAQLLVGPPADGVVQVVDRLLAVQAQDLRAARLAVRARTAGLTAADVDPELANRTLVVTWLNRSTAQPLNRSTAQPLNRSTAQPLNRSTVRPQMSSGSWLRLTRLCG